MKEKLSLSYYEQYCAFINRRYPFPFPDYVFEFADDINGEYLQEAAEKALDVNPAFRLTLRDGEDGFYMEPVDAKPVVREVPWKEGYEFAQDGLMWTMSYSGKRMVFTAFHLLCDGMGAIIFLQDVLKFYFARCGHYHGELKTLDADYAESYANPYRTAVPATTDLWHDLDYDELSSLDFEQFKALDAEPVIYRFDFNRAVIKEQSVASGTSTSAVISYYLAKAMADTLGKPAGKVSVAVVADLRTRFATSSNRNFTAESNLIYDIAKEKDWTREQVQKDMRRQLQEFLALERQQARIAQEHIWQKEILELSEEDQIANRNFLFQTFCTLRANICYSHLTKLGIPEEIENQLTDFHVAGAKGFCPRVCVFGSNFKDKITITISQYVKDDSFVGFFAERLRQDNVLFEQSQLDLHGNMNYKLNL